MKSKGESKGTTSTADNQQDDTSMANIHPSSILNGIDEELEHEMSEGNKTDKTENEIEDKRNTLSELFDETFINIIDLIDYENEIVKCSTEYQGFIRRYIAILKDLTRRVSDLKLLSTKHKDESGIETRSIDHLENDPTDTTKPSHPRTPRSYIRTPFSSELPASGESANINKSKDIRKSGDTIKSENISKSTNNIISTDILTSHGDCWNLKYLLLPALLGFLHLKIKDYNRTKLLPLVCVYFKDFVERCVAYEIVEDIYEVPKDLLKLKDIKDCKHYKEQKDIRRKHIEELSEILHKIKTTSSLNKSINQCHVEDEDATDFAKNSDNATTHKMKDSREESKNRNPNPCFPSDHGMDIPGVQFTSSFDQYVLYKYGRDYLKAKGKLEKRNQEMGGQSESNKQDESNQDSMWSIQQEVRQIEQGFKIIPGEKSFHTEKCCSEERYFYKSGESDENSCENHLSSKSSSCLITQTHFNKHLLSLFVHKCLNQMETCLIETQLQRSLGRYFRPCYLEHFKSVTNVDQDERLYEPVLLE